MKRNTEYEINQIEGTIIITKNFASAASVLNSSEYNIMKQLRADNPSFTVELRTIQKKANKKAHNGTPTSSGDVRGALLGNARRYEP